MANLPADTRIRHRWLFWLLVAAASSFFAEVISGSEPYPFFKPLGWFVIIPLYGLHSLILAAIVFQRGRSRLHVLFLAGILFGLYEAYITKVLWDPYWEAWFFFAGIAPFETALLIVWWHPFLSFIIPLLLVELFATSSSAILAGLPPAWHERLSRPRNLYLLAAYFGFLQASSQPPGGGLASGVSGLLVLGILLALWRRSGGEQHTLDDLLPRGRAFTVLAVLLGLLYLAAFFGLRPEALPGLGPQITIWLFYALTILGLRRALHQTRQQPLPDLPITPPSRGLVARVIAVYLAACLLFGFIPPPLKGLPLIINGFLGSLFGLAVLVYTIRQLRQPD